MVVLQQLLQFLNALLVPAILTAVDSELSLGPLSCVKDGRVLLVVPPKLVKLRTACHQVGRWPRRRAANSGGGEHDASHEASCNTILDDHSDSRLSRAIGAWRGDMGSAR